MQGSDIGPPFPWGNVHALGRSCPQAVTLPEISWWCGSISRSGQIVSAFFDTSLSGVGFAGVIISIDHFVQGGEKWSREHSLKGRKDRLQSLLRKEIAARNVRFIAEEARNI